jgi:Flp pilus assembly protein TadG
VDTVELIMGALVRYVKEDRGASAAEFAIVSIPFIGLVLGIIGVSMMVYANQTLQFATEAAARYYSVQTNLGNAPNVSAYAQGVYKGPAISPSFVPARGGCGPNGFQVTGTATFPLNTGLYNTSVSLQAHACYP